MLKKPFKCTVSWSNSTLTVDWLTRSGKFSLNSVVAVGYAGGLVSPAMPTLTFMSRYALPAMAGTASCTLARLVTKTSAFSVFPVGVSVACPCR